MNIELNIEFEMSDSALNFISSSSHVLPNTFKSFEELNDRYKWKKCRR